MVCGVLDVHEERASSSLKVKVQDEVTKVAVDLCTQ